MTFRIATEQQYGRPKVPPKKRRKRTPEQRKEDDHLNFIRVLPCAVCGSRERVEAAHLRSGSLEHGKPPTGMGQRPPHRWTTPLCAYHHREAPDAQHNMNELAFWSYHGIDPFILCKRLWEAKGDVEAMQFVIRTARQYTEKAR